VLSVARASEEEVLAQVRLGDPCVQRDIRSVGQHLRQEPRDVRQRACIEPLDRHAQRVAAQPVGHRTKRQPALSGVRARSGDPDTLAASPRQQFFGEPRLADARLACQHDETGRTRAGSVPGRLQLTPFGRAPDERN
jgi:hypothetical protein